VKNVADQDMEEKDTIERNSIVEGVMEAVITDAATEDTTEDVPAVQVISVLVDSTMDGEDSSRKEKRSKSLKNTRRSWKRNSRLLKNTSKN